MMEVSVTPSYWAPEMMFGAQVVFPEKEMD
jgi:hypothetical protein